MLSLLSKIWSKLKETIITSLKLHQISTNQFLTYQNYIVIKPRTKYIIFQKRKLSQKVPAATPAEIVVTPTEATVAPVETVTAPAKAAVALVETTTAPAKDVIALAATVIALAVVQAIDICSK